jgi:AcrR family transcriptional regulator
MTSGSAGWSRARRASTRDDTRAAIVDAALRLFSTRGYVGVRVEDIARESGVSRATFYKHFSERDQILAELFSRLIDAEVEIEAEGRDPEARVLSLLRQVAERMLGQETLARFVYSLPVRHDSILPGGSAAPAVMKLVQSELQTAYDAGSVRTDIPLEAYVEVIGRVFEAAMRDWAEGRTDDVIERLEQLVSVTFNGINTRRKPQARPKG